MTTSWLMVVPAIDPDQAAAFDAGLRLDRRRVLIVDNHAAHRRVVVRHWPGRLARPGRNLGVAGSWNLGVRAVLAEGADWLVIASTSLRWGPSGGRDFVDRLDSCPADVPIAGGDNLGWHLIALRSSALRVVGEFDEGFWPAYCEEVDWLYRARLAGFDDGDNGVPHHLSSIDAAFGEQAATLTANLAPAINLSAMQDRYETKWGGPFGQERFATPWNKSPTEELTAP